MYGRSVSGVSPWCGASPLGWSRVVRADAGALVTAFRDVSTGDVARAGSLSAFEWLDFWLFM